MTPRALLVLLSISVLLVGCQADEEPPPRRPTPIETEQEEPEAFVPSSDCRNEKEIASDISKRFPPTLVIDVDGDGEDERVSMHLDPEGPPECLAFTVVEKADVTFSGVIVPTAGADPLVFGRILGSGQVTDPETTDIIVLVAAGASTQFAVVYRWEGTFFVPMKVQGGDGSFAFGGSTGHLDSVDCFGSAPLLTVATSAVRTGDAYKVVRRFYEPIRGTFVRRPNMTERLTLSEDELSTIPEFRAGPFASCPTD